MFIFIFNFKFHFWILKAKKYCSKKFADYFLNRNILNCSKTIKAKNKNKSKSNFIKNYLKLKY